jgi:membrane-bound metal-dependent hydrolase YbcI (DUF457 family)
MTDLVSVFCGGHRRGSHSILGVIAVFWLAWVATNSAIGTAVVVAIATGLALAAAGLWIPGKQPTEWWPINLGISALVAVTAYQQAWTLPGWLPWAIAGGAAAHIIGDMLTVTGCPLGWPISAHHPNTRITPWPFKAGGPYERWVAVPLLVTLNIVLLAYLT